MKHFKETINDIARRLTGSPVIFLLFLGVIILPNIILSATEMLSPAGRIANIMLPLGVYCLLLSLTKRLGLSIWLFFPILFFAAFQLVLLDLYGRSIIAVDMFINVATTNSSEVSELLGNLEAVIALVIILYVPMLVWATVALIRKQPRFMLSGVFMRRGRIAGASIAAVGILAVFIASGHHEGYNIGRDLYPVNVVNNLKEAIVRESRLTDYATTSANFRFNTTTTHPDSLREIYVIVVGETSRAANWQLLGYDRPTNPLLSSRRDNLIVFDHVMSESNTTHKSVPMMLSHLPAEKFDRLYSSHGIISAFKEAGFKTAFVSNQRRNHSFIDFFGEEADTCLFIKETERFTATGEPHDICLTECLRELIDRGDSKLFVVLHSYGSHFNYVDRYADDCRRFLPDDATVASPSNRSQLINAYDNSIVATDLFLDRVISALDNVPGAATAMLYTSDHGEDIFDDSRERFLHASPCPTFNQLYVPMIAFTNRLYRQLYPASNQNLASHAHDNVSSTASMFHTMVDLAGLNTTLLDRSKSLASGIYRTSPRVYINDHNEAVDLRHAGFQKEDFESMKRHGFL